MDDDDDGQHVIVKAHRRWAKKTLKVEMYLWVRFSGTLREHLIHVALPHISNLRVGKQEVSTNKKWNKYSVDNQEMVNEFKGSQQMNE
jgi:hypothetical protein